MVETLEDLGNEDPTEGSNGFYDMFKKQLFSLIDMQLTHQTASPSPPKPRARNSDHQSLLVNATTTSHSGADIVLPSKVKTPLIMGASQVDLNVEGAFAGLDAPRQPGESTQAYEQQRTAALCLRNTPVPAFFGQAGSLTTKATSPSARRRIVLPKVETEASVGVPPTGKRFHIDLADNLRDRTVYQQICNADLFEWGHSNYEDQGITFGPNREVNDEMKNMYQSSLRAATAPGGGDPGDEADDDSDNDSHHQQPQDNNDPHRPQQMLHGNNHCGRRNGGGDGDRHPPIQNGSASGPPDGGDDGDDESDGSFHPS